MIISERLHYNEKIESPNRGTAYWYRFIGTHLYEFHYSHAAYPHGTTYTTMDVWKTPASGPFGPRTDRIHCFREIGSPRNQSR